MINDKISIVTSPDYAHSSDYKICLVGDTPLINEILHILDKDTRNISVHYITKEDNDFTWIANTVNSSNFVFIDNQTKLDRLHLGWILSRPGVYHNIEEAKLINSNYENNVLSSFIKQLDSNNIGGPIGI
tara:strand:- start:1562 stop:1951 length:390 start_codon:yes stop_codon:yes gene_type:complete